jgi:GNAT superfamily N-acetyltransferase
MIEVKPFEQEHLAAACALFAAKYRGERQRCDLLPARFEDESAIQKLLTQMVGIQPGVVAFAEGEMIGYLTGFSNIPTFKGSATGVYTPIWGHCITPTVSIENVFTALYCELSAEWVANRCHTHALSYFPAEGVLSAHMFKLGYGMLLIDGIRDFASLEVEVDEEVIIREAADRDMAQLMVISSKLDDHLRGAPVFLNRGEEQNDLARFSSSFRKEGANVLVAEVKGELVACIRGKLNSGPSCDLFDLAGSLGIDFAYTDPDLRKQGIATWLLQELLRRGKAEGMQRCVVDFESANLVADTFWLKYFQPICQSVMRRIDERI